MDKITIKTVKEEYLADKNTPVQTYLQLRDKFRMCTLLESTDFHIQKGKFSFIACSPLAEFKVSNGIIDANIKGNKQHLHSTAIDAGIQEFIDLFQVEDKNEPSSGLYGYISYDAISYFEEIKFQKKPKHDVPDIHLVLYKYVIAFDHFHQKVTFYENVMNGGKHELGNIVEQTFKTGSMYFPFEMNGDESSNMQDEDFIKIVENCISHCYRGDVFQMVPSRRFQQKFIGDDFNVYRALRLSLIHI